MSFTPIDYDTWERREFLEFFKQTTIYVTVQTDITALYKTIKRRGLRLYPALVYCAASVINRHAAFRYAYDKRRRIGLWDAVHPFYTVPRKGNPELFSIKSTPYRADYFAFYEEFIRDYAAAETCGRLFCDQNLPENVCGISIVPESAFSAFSFSGDPKPDFTPFTMFGKFTVERGRIVLPVCGEFSHAVNDGFHVSRFFDEFEKIANNLLADGARAGGKI